MGRRKTGRDVDGVVLLDKPPGCSSNTALQRVRRAFDARKAGHTGSLDPLASGLLPICLGEATKVSSYMLRADKTYQVTAAHGHETTTGDREGEPSRITDTVLPERSAIESALAGFLGEQQQIPPMYSALKHQGRRLYEIARAGGTVERAPRSIRIASLALVDRSADTFTLEARVSGGTYIRTLIEDIAASWDGRAHVAALRRVAVGPLGRDSPLTPLADIESSAERGDASALEQIRRSVSTVIADWPEALVDDHGVLALRQGRAATAHRRPAHTHDPEALARISSLAGELIGLGTVDASGQVAPKRIFTRGQR